MPTITVQSGSAGTTPLLGYNLAHFLAGSNAADWWRYSGARAARAFVSPSEIEPNDDLGSLGDGVSSGSGFSSRRSALRANAASSSAPLDPQYVNWNAFLERYQNAVGDTNRFTIAHAFGELRQQGVSILANITASPSRFPLADSGDWANAWELWQHYYAQAFLLSRDYGVERYGIFNEPNNWTWPAGTADPVANWLRRLRLASDAIQSALADVNSRYGRNLQPRIFAPNTANGATKYNNTSSGDTWGRRAVLGRRQRWDDSTDPSWSNFQVYNYQKYDSLAADFLSDYQALRAALDVDGATDLPLALTEFNVRTGSNYDARTETLDSPSDYSALAANSIALSQAGARELYLFKFGQTARSAPTTYPVAKNGTHYVQNGTSGLNNVGGATKGAEAYRLFVKGSGSGRQRLLHSSDAGAAVWVQIAREAGGGTVWATIANTGTSPVSLELDLSALQLAGLGLSDGSLAVIEEVSGSFSGAVSRVAALQGGRLPAATLPAQAVWLVALTPAQGILRRSASEDTQLADGTGKNQGGGALSSLTVRSDGTVNGRRVSLLKFNVQNLPADLERVLLSLNASTLSQSGAIQAHVYGVSDDSWSEASSTWASLPALLKQNVAAGNRIEHNVVAGQGSATTILGQLVVTGSTARPYQLDVSDFVHRQSDGWASFLVVQDHRWDVALPSLSSGDTQSDGLRISSREAGGTLAPELQLLTRSATPPQPPPPPPPPPPPAAPGFVFCLSESQTLSGLATANEDLIGFNGAESATTAFSLVLDGSGVGLGALQLDALARLSASEWLFSFTDATTLAGISLDDSDLVRFSRAANGTASFALWFDASDVGLSTNDEDVDALALVPSSGSAGGYDLLLSTVGPFSAGGLAGEDEDIIRFRPSATGNSTSGSLSLFFDGSSFGLAGSASEDIDALALQEGRLYLSTVGSFSVNRADGTALSGFSEDSFAFTPTTYGGSGGLQVTAGRYNDGLLFDGSSYGLGNNDLKGLELPL